MMMNFNEFDLIFNIVLGIILLVLLGVILYQHDVIYKLKGVYKRFKHKKGMTKTKYKSGLSFGDKKMYGDKKQINLVSVYLNEEQIANLRERENGKWDLVLDENLIDDVDFILTLEAFIVHSVSLERAKELVEEYINVIEAIYKLVREKKE